MTIILSRRKVILDVKKIDLVNDDKTVRLTCSDGSEEFIASIRIRGVAGVPDGDAVALFNRISELLVISNSGAISIPV